MPRFLAELTAIFIVGAAFLLLHYLGEMEPITAAIFAVSVFIIFKTVLILLARAFGEKVEPETPSQSVSLDDIGGRARLQVFFERYGIGGSANVRNGQVYPVVPAEKLDEVTRKLRAAVNLALQWRLAGTDLYVKTADRLSPAFSALEEEIENTRIIGLTVPELEQVLGVMERCVEERHASRKLYRGFDRAEVMNMARAATADFIAKQPSDSADNLIVANAIRRGEHDDNQFVRLAARTIELILQVKGNNV